MMASWLWGGRTPRGRSDGRWRVVPGWRRPWRRAWVKDKVETLLLMVADPDDGGKPCALIQGMDRILY